MMAGQIRLFEKIDGLLVEVEPSAADKTRNGRTVSRVSLEIDVLWTTEEEAERAAEEAATKQRQISDVTERAKLRKTAEAKLSALGLTPEELREILS